VGFNVGSLSVVGVSGSGHGGTWGEAGVAGGKMGKGKERRT
jgi:hypothetical protein